MLAKAPHLRPGIGEVFGCGAGHQEQDWQMGGRRRSRLQPHPLQKKRRRRVLEVGGGSGEVVEVCCSHPEAMMRRVLRLPRSTLPSEAVRGFPPGRCGARSRV